MADTTSARVDGPGTSPAQAGARWAELHRVARQDGALAAGLVNAMSAGTLAEATGTSFVSVTPEVVVATMRVAGNTQPAGLLHGGASAALAETVGSVGAAVAAAPGRAAVGVDLSATHHRGVRPESCRSVTATGRPLHVGRRVASYEVVVTDEQGRRVCTARLTCQLVPDGPEPDGPGADGSGDRAGPRRPPQS